MLKQPDSTPLNYVNKQGVKENERDCFCQQH